MAAWCRFVFLLALLPYVGWLVMAWEFHVLDHVNLAIHETGHVLFSPLSETWHLLGGTILQLAFPLLFVLSAAWRKRRFDAAICGIWLGESLIYTAAYIEDAYLMSLPLVGGEIHDWNWLLASVGMVSWCEEIGLAVWGLGVFVIACSVTWATKAIVSEMRGKKVPPVKRRKPAAKRA